MCKKTVNFCIVTVHNINLFFSDLHKRTKILTWKHFFFFKKCLCTQNQVLCILEQTDKQGMVIKNPLLFYQYLKVLKRSFTNKKYPEPNYF